MENVGWIDAFWGGHPVRRPEVAAQSRLTLVAILTLADGIGANIAAFTVIRAVFAKSVAVSASEQLVCVFDDLRGSNDHDVGMSAPSRRRCRVAFCLGVEEFQRRKFVMFVHLWPIGSLNSSLGFRCG